MQRVPDGDAALLRYLAEIGIVPGETVEVRAAEPFDGPVTVRVHRSDRSISRELAARIEVRHAEAAPVAEPCRNANGVADVLPGEARVLEAAQRSLTGERRGLRGLWPFLGPAFIAAVAYVDPGNFATNIAAGAKFGYLLLWVIVVSNLMAMLIQTLSAKLGIATGLNLARGLPRALPAHRLVPALGSGRG